MGISTTVDYSLPIEKQLRLFAESGFDFISFGANLTHNHFNVDDEFESVLNLAEFLGLRVDSAHAPFGNGFDLADQDISKRKMAVANHFGFIERCRKFGIFSIIIHPHHFLQADKAEVLKWSAESIELILKRVSNEIDILIENLPDHRGSWICARLLDIFPANKVGWCYDSSHENMSGSPFHLLKKYYSRITQTHLSDNLGRRDDHFIPGEGNIDWLKLVTLMGQNPKIRKLLFEVGTGEPLGRSPDEFIIRAAQAAHNLIDAAD